MMDFMLSAEIQDVVQEILVYKWIESEKAGSDIGMQRAAEEWIGKHYDEWFQYNHLRFYA